jgi:dTDP-D-glucose 4,6-dehydratase
MLVTGGAGFMGAAFVHHAVQNHPGYEVPLLLLAGMPAGRMDS